MIRHFEPPAKKTIAHSQGVNIGAVTPDPSEQPTKTETTHKVTTARSPGSAQRWKMSRLVCALFIGLAGALIMTALLSTPGHQGLVAAPTLSFPSARMAPKASAVGIGVCLAEKGGSIDWAGIYTKIRRWNAQDREVALDRKKRTAEAIFHRERSDSPVSWNEDSGVGVKMDWVDHVKDNKAVDYSNEGRFWWQSSDTKCLRRVGDAGAMDAAAETCKMLSLQHDNTSSPPTAPAKDPHSEPHLWLHDNPWSGFRRPAGGFPTSAPTRKKKSQDRQSSRRLLRCKGGRVGGHNAAGLCISKTGHKHCIIIELQKVLYIRDYGWP